MKKLLFLIPILFVGCVTQDKCLRKFPPSDSTVYKEVLIPKDTLIQTFVEVTDTIIYDSVLFTKDSVFIFREHPFKVNRIFLKGKYSEAEAWIHGDKLRGRLSEGGLIPAAFWLKYYEKRVTELKSKTVIKEVPKEPTWWERFWKKFWKIAGIVGLIETAIILYIVWDLIKFRLKELVF